MVVDSGCFREADQVTDIVLVPLLTRLVKVCILQQVSGSFESESTGNIVESVETSLAEGSPCREGDAVGARRRVAGQSQCLAHVPAGGGPVGLVGGKRLAWTRCLSRKEVVLRWMVVAVVGGFVVAGVA